MDGSGSQRPSPPSTFNVERYLFQSSGTRTAADELLRQRRHAPLDASSTFIRSGGGGFQGGGAGMRAANVLASIQETLAAVKDGRIRTYNDVFSIVKP